MSSDVSLEQVLDIYGRILEDPNYERAVRRDLDAAGGPQAVYLNKLMAVVLPEVIIDKSQSLAVAPIGGWYKSVRTGYKELGLPLSYYGGDGAPAKSGVMGYLADLAVLSEQTESLGADKVTLDEQAIPLGEGTRSFIELGKHALTRMVYPLFTSKPKEQASDIDQNGSTGSFNHARDIATSPAGYRLVREETELDRGARIEQLQLLVLLATICGYRIRFHAPHDVDNPPRKPVVSAQLVVRPRKFENIPLTLSLREVDSALKGTKTSIDLPLSHKIISLVAKRMTFQPEELNLKTGTDHQHFNLAALKRLYDIFEKLDPGVFATRSSTLDNMYAALVERVELNQITQENLEQFWRHFVKPEQDSNEAS